MAKTYYGFDKVTGYSPVIDFRSVRQEIDKELDSITQERDAKKKVIEENTKAAMEALDKDEGLGELDQLNDRLLGVSDQIKDNVMLQYELMRSGKVRPSTFNKFVQNSTASVNHIKTMAQTYQDKALDIQQPGVASVEIFLSNDVLNLGYFNENSFFQNPSTGEIYLAGINEDGSIKYDENGDIVNKRSTNYMQNRRRSIIMEEDFNGYADKIVTAYGVNATNEPGKTSEFVDEVFKDLDTKVHSLDNIQVGDMLSQYLSDDRFSYTDDREEAQRSIDSYNELNDKYIDQYEILQNEDSTDEEKAAAQNQMNSLRMQMDGVKVLMYAAETENGSVIDMEVTDTHRLIAHDVYETMFRSKMGTATNAAAQASNHDQGRSDDRRQATAYYDQMKKAWENINSGDNYSIEAGVNTMVSIYRGLGVNVAAGSVNEDGVFKLQDANGYEFVASDLTSSESAKIGFKNLLLALGGTDLGVEFSNKVNRSFNYTWNEPTGSEVGTPIELVGK